jgi:hypothetical protein
MVYKASHIRLVLVGILINFFNCITTHTAIFTVYNQGTKAIICEHTWNSEDLESTIQPYANDTFNSGFANVIKIRWREHHTDIRQARAFEVPVQLGFANVGGKFVIFDDGKYKYYFGVDGFGESPAQKINQ